MNNDHAGFSRRAFLRCSAALAGLADRHLGWPLSPLHLDSGPGWVILHRGSHIVFELRTEWFAGNASVWAEQTTQQIAFGLENSRHMGIDLTGDATFELWEGLYGIQAAIQHHGLGLLFRGSAEDWLSQRGLSSYLQSSAALLDVEGTEVVVSPGPVTLLADGTLHFTGETTAAFHRYGIRLLSQSAHLRLPSPAETKTELRRQTTLALERDFQHWPLQLPRGNWKYEGAEDLFHRALIEADEKEDGSRCQRVLFSSPDRASDFRVLADRQMRGSDGRAIELAMKEPHYALDLSQGTNQFEAQLAGRNSVRFGPLDLLLAPSQSRPALQAGDKGCCVIVEAGLAGDIDNALILPTEKPSPWNVTVLSDDKPPRKYSDATIKMIGENPVLEGALNFRILRPQDAVDLCFRITNVVLRLQTAQIGRLELAHNASEPSDISLLIADFPAQAMIMPKTACSGVTEGDDCSSQCTPPVRHQSRVAAPSRVSMQFLSSDDPPVNLGLRELLEWARYPLNISPLARQNPDAKQNSPTVIPDFATEIIAPAGLSVSPDEYHTFFSTGNVRFNDGVSQIWTARLAKRTSPLAGTSGDGAKTHFPVTADRRPALRPLVARSLAHGDEDYVLNRVDLQSIVDELSHSTANARHCILSPSHGAWLDFGAIWSPMANDTSSFHEKIVGLLEGSVEFTYEGWLVPTGHRVEVVKSGKLQWCRQSRDGVPFLVADFIERFKIVYREPTLVCYDIMRKDLAKQNLLQCPFNSIRLVGKETSYLDDCEADAFTKNCEGGSPNIADYWTWISPTPGTTAPFEFPVELTDRAGTKHLTTMQMVVACFKESYNSQYNKKLVDAYNRIEVDHDNCKNPKGKVDPTVTFHGERVAYAKPTRMGNTAYPTNKMILQAASFPDLTAAKANLTIPFYPQMKSTDLVLEQVNAFSNPASAALAPRTFEFATLYKREPFDDIATPPFANRGEVILSLTKDAQGKCSPVPMTFNGSLGGGLAMPTSDVIALARKTGTVFSSSQKAVDDLEDVLTNIGKTGMTVAGMFEGVGRAASLLGAVKLSDVLDEVADGIAQASQLPLLAVKQLQTLEQETIGQLQALLQPILEFREIALKFYNDFNTQITQLRVQLQLAIRTASSLVRVIATEQRPDDIATLDQQTLDSSLSDMAKQLASKMRLSALDRIQQASTWPPVTSDNPPKPILPTLYQVRDYALHQLLESSAEALAQSLDQALETGEQQLQEDLDLASTLAAQAVGDLAGSLIFQFATAVGNLLNHIQSADVVEIVNDFETISDVIAAIPSLDKSAVGLRNSITTNLAKTSGPCSVDRLRQRASALNTALSQAGSQLSPPVRAALQNALQQNGGLEMTCKSVLQNAVEQVNNANILVTNVLVAEEAVRKQFLSVQSKIQQAIDDARALFTLPKNVNISYTYQTALHDSPPFIADFNGNRSQFELVSSVLVNLDGTPPTFDITASVTNFRLNLIPSFPFVIIGFDVARFTSHNGGSPTVYCPFNADNVQLVGPLDFVANLAATLGLPPEMIVQITGLGVIVGLNILIPAEPCGAFNIVGLSVYTAIKLDFTGAPLRVIFGFATPNQHFTMTYLFLGGGGFINLEFTPSDTTTMAVTAALEFGAMAALDFGVAEGEVHIFGGFYMSLRPNDLLLSGYYRAGGDFDVLGLISASLEFVMALSYEDRGGQAWLSGDCELDIDVHVLFFSASVSLHMHHDFSGRSGN